MSCRTAIALFSRDLRVHDNPMLRAAVDAADHVVPLFVLDDAIWGSRNLGPNRASFLVDSLRDLDRSLRERGAPGLVVRRGGLVAEVVAIAEGIDADEVHISADWSGHAQRRHRELHNALATVARRLVLHEETIPILRAGAVTPGGKDHFSVFTPYFRRWAEVPRRALLDAPDELRSLPVRHQGIPAADSLCPGEHAPDLPPGGESAGRRRLHDWMRSAVENYADRNDELAGDHTSRLSPYLHFGCLSAVAMAEAACASRGGQALVRQLAWRDFNLQVLAARPEVAQRDYRDRGDRWRDDRDGYRAWQDGRTGYPIVDAAMRQLRAEGWMHNRARLIVGNFLTKTLYIDWRAGARHFMRHLVDADVSNNQLNWQWVAGTGTDTRPNRVLNPLLQARRHDPNGDYVRRYVPELVSVAGPVVHTPWRLPEKERALLNYPDPIVDLAQARERFLDARRAIS